ATPRERGTGEKAEGQVAADSRARRTETNRDCCRGWRLLYPEALDLNGAGVTAAYFARVAWLWQTPLPESRNDFPSSGINSQVYFPGERVNFKMPYVCQSRTSLFVVAKPRRSWLRPPVPATISRIPCTGSPLPSGFWGAKRS